jgi:hypothetical protein
MQKSNDEDGSFRIVRCFSKCFNQAQQRYSTTRREMLSMLWACRKFKTLIEDAPSLTFFTDHKPLLSTDESKDALLENWKLQVWSLRPTPIIRYLPGKSNVIADTQSRMDKKRTSIRLIRIRQAALYTVDWEEIKRQDTELRRYLQLLRSGQEFDESEFDSKLRRLSRRYIWLDNQLYYKHIKDEAYLVPTPDQRRKLILQKHEELQHQQAKVVHAALSSDIRYQGMDEEIASIVSTCTDCQRGFTRHGATEKRQRNYLTSTSKLPLFSELEVDLIVELPEYFGFSNIVVCRGKAIGHVKLYPTASKDKHDVHAALLNYVSTYGCPQIIRHDRGSEFLNNVIWRYSQNFISVSS